MSFKTYKDLFAEIKQKVAEAQLKTVVAANAQMLLLYWQMGNYILQNQQAKGWGAKIIDQLSADLKKEFPHLKGFSPRNLKYMRKFAESYSTPVIQHFILIEQQFKNTNTLTQQSVTAMLSADKQQFEIVQQPVAQLEESLFLQSILARVSWSHQVVLMDKERHIGKRLWYMLNTLEHGISLNILAMQIESRLFERQIKAKKINNFERTLPQPQADFANYLLKDPYIFDFVQAKEKADERNIEEQLANHIGNSA